MVKRRLPSQISVECRHFCTKLKLFLSNINDLNPAFSLITDGFNARSYIENCTMTFWKMPPIFNICAIHFSVTLTPLMVLKVFPSRQHSPIRIVIGISCFKTKLLTKR